jgi:multidrug efflux pump subunit AcrB
MHTPFGFVAFLGVASLIGVIVSHVIVPSDFIEEIHEKRKPLERALPDAEIERIRPVVMITVGAMILLCSLSHSKLALSGDFSVMPGSVASFVASVITLLLVPVFYSIFVLNPKWIKWENTRERREAQSQSQQQRDDDMVINSQRGATK